MAVPGSSASAEGACAQQHWRTVALVAAWDGSPQFEVDGEQRFHGRVDTAVVRKKCGQAKVVVREQEWDLLDPATAVEIEASQGIPPRCDRGRWQHTVTVRSRDVTPAHATEEGERHFERAERWVVREKCGAYQLKRRTSDWVLAD